MSARPPAIVSSSFLAADPSAIWASVTSVHGVNHELWPLFRMTAPPHVRDNGLEAVVVGERVCRSWVLLFGVVPVDYDDITLARLDSPRSFVERSAMFSQRLWEHERTITPAPGGGLLVDRVSYEPRLAIPEPLLRHVYAFIFGHRHRRLRARFGGRAAPSSGRRDEPQPHRRSVGP